MNQPKRSLILHQLCCPVSNTREGKQRTNWVYLLWFLVKEIRQKACVSSPVELPFEAVIPINQLVSSNETEVGLGLSKVLKKVLKKVNLLKKVLKKVNLLKKALKKALKKVNLLKKGLKKEQPVKKVNSRKCIHSKK